jgi:hypothetical protein
MALSQVCPLLMIVLTRQYFCSFVPQTACTHIDCLAHSIAARYAIAVHHCCALVVSVASQLTVISGLNSDHLEGD